MSDKNVSKKPDVQYKGAPVKGAERAVILLHGTGSDADDIMQLSDELWLQDTCYIAPQADNINWLPHTFMYPIIKNEPSVSLAFKKLDFIFNEISGGKVENNKIFIIGFSQGACLALEYAARNIKKYGGVFALSGGLLGENIDRSNYSGDFEGMPVFLGCGDDDPEVPLKRINETEEVFKGLNASVTKKIYPGKKHEMLSEEIAYINKIILR